MAGTIGIFIVHDKSKRKKLNVDENLTIGQFIEKVSSFTRIAPNLLAIKQLQRFNSGQMTPDLTLQEVTEANIPSRDTPRIIRIIYPRLWGIIHIPG